MPNILTKIFPSVFGLLIGLSVWAIHYYTTDGPSGSAAIMPQSAGFAAAVNIASPSVVNIRSNHKTQQRILSPLDILFNLKGRNVETLQTSLGSAVVIDSGGYMLTNYHVIQNATDILVELPNGKTAQALHIGHDAETDLAVLKVAHTLNLPSIPIGSAKNLQAGEAVLAIGNPLGLGQTVTQGIVSATNRFTGNPYAWFIQTDAAINQGNSGGALINAEGDLVGINSFIVSKSGGSDGLGFAIPVDLAMDIASEIIKTGRVARGWVGHIQVAPVTAIDAQALNIPESGLQVRALQYNTPLITSGMLLGDIITHYKDKPVNAEIFNSAILNSRPGDVLPLTLWRNNQQIKIRVPVSQRP